MAESRLQRWSRNKAKASKQAEPSPPSSVEPDPSPEQQELATNEALPEHEVLAKYDLPDPGAIELGTDITGFMRKEIPELLRRKALRALWRSNPVLAVLDGLNDYDEDFTAAATGTGVVRTLYKVGQGLIDRTATRDEKVDEDVAGQVDVQAVEQAEAPVTRTPAEAIEESEPAVAVEVLNTSRHYEPVASEPEVESMPRYRPRMRFDY